jgi:DNA-binding NarL/FixJ family response regulator
VTVLRVVVADDHAVVRAGLCALLGQTDDLQVVGEAADGAAAVARVRELRPDVVLMDLSMPGMDGTEAIVRITADGAGPAVVALTSFAERDRIVSTLEAGAVGYVLKDAAPAEILRAVRAAAAGQSPLDPQVTRILLGTPGAPRPPELTAREREVLALLAQGHNNKQIARQLGISDATVKAHLTRVFATLGVADRTQAALWAQRHGYAGQGD